MGCLQIEVELVSDELKQEDLAKDVTLGELSAGEAGEPSAAPNAIETPVSSGEFDPEDLIDEIVEEDASEGASPIEEFVEESLESVEIPPMDWYILKVQVNRENSICDALMRNIKRAGMDRFFEQVLVPTEDVREFSKAGKPKIVKRKLYPGYIVVRMAINDDTWFLVRDTPGIGDFTGAAGKPVPLGSVEIERILSATLPAEAEDGQEENIKTAIKFKVADRVRVKEGYFQNYEGEVSAIDERNGRVTVMINIFGRANPVQLDHWQMEKL
ncbi:MAG: transcription termination/antitermination factor NusG [Pirellulaceae bacterium]|jgi:transcription termination/antitermination protein NusG|nr:transcription termination/antitermination factor NusG [Pirellulaceae bacterium]